MQAVDPTIVGNVETPEFRVLRGGIPDGQYLKLI